MRSVGRARPGRPIAPSKPGTAGLRPARRGAALAAAVWSIAAAAGAQPKAIGVAAAVRGSVTAKTPEATRPVRSGGALYADDHVRTGADGRLQALLVDETTFTLGPNSSLVLDRFVYDPKSGLGAVSARVAEGVFRLVTGKVAAKRPAAMKVSLPVGSLGIEGTIVAGRVEKGRTTIVLLGPGPAVRGERVGSATVSNAGRTVRLTRPGFGTVLERGLPPRPPFRLDDAALRDLTVALLPPTPSGAGDAGAAREARADALTAGAQLAAAGGLDLSALTAAAEQALGATQRLSSVDASALFYRFSNPAAAWEELRLLQGLGSLPFVGNGVFTGGAPCPFGPANCTGTWGYNVNLDFDRRTLTGNASITTTSINFPAIAIAVDYTGLAGAATSRVAIPGGGTCTAATCNVTFNLRNAEDFAGKVMDGSVTFNNGVASGSGTAGAVRP
ncbi:MAG: FecR domain-containing protein [Elusimicrobia bacterium]|nr:FecR domain-containing protein [Elusimicrobiota bacterium]